MRRVMRRRLFELSALAALLGLLLVVALIWPLPEVGLIADMHTGTITQIRPGSLADHAGLLPGDRILSAYGYPWEANNTRITLLPLPWRHGTPTELMLERGTETRLVILYAGPPSIAYQLEKGLRLLVALICWGTGYLLGTSPRAHDPRLRWAGWFWVLLGLSIGLYHLAYLTSYVLAVAVLWFQCTVLAPFAVALHLWYPARPITPATRARAKTLLIIAVALLQLSADLLVITSASIVTAYERMLRMTSLTYIGTFLVSVAVLAYAYRTTSVKHIRRQVRIIWFACVLTVSWWMLLFLAFLIAPELVALIPSGAATIGAVVIPLAYLATGVSADLMRLDQVVRRAVISALASLVVVAVVGTLVWTQLLEVSPAVVLIVAASLYWPCFQLTQRLMGGGSLSDATYQPLRQAAESLGSLLDRAALLRTLREGFDQTFQCPPIALYCLENINNEELRLVEARDIHVPATVPLRLLNSVSGQRTVLLPAGEVQKQLGLQASGETEVALVFHPDMLYLGVIRGADKLTLALLVLGPRGDRDPYRELDTREIAHLLAAAALAFANSASFTAALRADAETRKTFRRALEIRQRIEAETSRTIHEKMLNGALIRNRLRLRELLMKVRDPWVLEKLKQIDNEERNMSTNLRHSIEQLQPTGVSDPFGLEATLRQCAEDAEDVWGNVICLEPVPQGQAIPLDSRIQHQIVLIVKEALNNASNHAKDATNITISLRYPAQLGESLVISIRDNGRVWKRVAPRQGHYGLRYMKESATSIGLEIDWKPLPDGGTEVIMWGSPTLPPPLEDDPAYFEPFPPVLPDAGGTEPEPISADTRRTDLRSSTGETHD